MNSKDAAFSWDFELTPKEIVSSLIDEIEKHRQQHKTLRQIHTVLSKNSSFSLSFSSFRNNYYQLRKKKCIEPPANKNAVRRGKSPITSITSELKAESANSQVADESLIEVADAAPSEPLTAKEKIAKRIAAHQKIAAMHFSN